MKRVKVPGIVNIFKVSEPEEIAALAQDSRIDREFRLRTCPINWLLLRRSLAVLSLEGRLFPTMTRRDSAQRQDDQEKLWNFLNERVPAIAAGPEELELLAILGPRCWSGSRSRDSRPTAFGQVIFTRICCFGGKLGYRRSSGRSATITKNINCTVVVRYGKSQTGQAPACPDG